MKYTDEYVLFWKGPLSQWVTQPFEHRGVTYSCGEKWMMACKAVLFGDEAKYAEILAETNPRKIQQLGREVQGFDEEVWCNWREDIVYAGSYLRFSQNPDALKVLFSAKGRLLVEVNPKDDKWGIALGIDDPRALDRTQWRGLNLLGKELTETCEFLSDPGGRLVRHHNRMSRVEGLLFGFSAQYTPNSLV